MLQVHDTCPAEYAAVAEVTSPGALDASFRRALHAAAVGMFGEEMAAPLAVPPRAAEAEAEAEGADDQPPLASADACTACALAWHLCCCLRFAAPSHTCAARTRCGAGQRRPAAPQPPAARRMVGCQLTPHSNLTVLHSPCWACGRSERPQRSMSATGPSGPPVCALPLQILSINPGGLRNPSVRRTLFGMFLRGPWWLLPSCSGVACGLCGGGSCMAAGRGWAGPANAG